MWLTLTATSSGVQFPSPLQNVFSEPVQLDKSWTPKVVPKTEEQKAEIDAVRAPPSRLDPVMLCIPLSP